ncbi:cell death-inducing p53-target protein 1-like isoform X2 [Centroberyx affinis]
MTSYSEVSELERISTEMNNISLKRDQLQERKKMLSILQEFKSHAVCGGQVEGASDQHEIDSIDDELNQLSDKQAVLQRCQEKIVNAQSHKKVSIITPSQKVPAKTPVCEPSVFFIEAPPSVPAPTVILDKENLPAWPSKTQCPECRQFITTEIVSSVSSVTWLVCLMTSLLGCVAGCCLIPFCMDNFKDISHTCPRCRTSIHTIKRF